MPFPPKSTTPRTFRSLTMALVGVLVAALLSLAAPVVAQAAEKGTIVNGGFIISDADFFDSDAMTVKEIQTFLDGKVSTCRATKGNPACLESFTADLPAKKADAYCTAVTAKKGATAAEIIAASALACGISPKVILVMLQKEQGLVTSTAPSERAYKAAMGQGCPDTAPCDAAQSGFVNQVYLGARQLQRYTQTASSWRYKAGKVNTIYWSPDASCGTSRSTSRTRRPRTSTSTHRIARISRRSLRATEPVTRARRTAIATSTTTTTDGSADRLHRVPPLRWQPARSRSTLTSSRHPLRATSTRRRSMPARRPRRSAARG